VGGLLRLNCVFFSHVTSGVRVQFFAKMEMAEHLIAIYESSIFQEHIEEYIPFRELYHDIIKGSDQYCSEEFYRKLELSYRKSKNFADQWLGDLVRSAAAREILNEFLNLNSFVVHNEEALQAIIALHDAKYVKSKLFLSWR
jgi:hypothetical protein